MASTIEAIWQGPSIKFVLIAMGIGMAVCAIISMVNPGNQLGNGFLSSFGSVFIILGGALVYFHHGETIKKGLSSSSEGLSDLLSSS